MENKEKSSGSEEPRSSNSKTLQKPCTNAQNVSTSRGSEVEEEVPLRPLPGYDKESSIDTRMLGREPIGTQTGKNGPKGQKFVCSKCRQKRWILDSEAASAANLTRFSTCLFCDLRGHTDRQINKQNDLLSAQLIKLQERFEKALGEFSLKIQKLEGGARQPSSPVGLRTEFDAMKSQLFSELHALKARVEVKAPETRVSPSTPGVVSVTSDGDSPSSAGGYIDDMYRRVVLGPRGLSVGLHAKAPTRPATVPAGPVAVTDEGARRKRKRGNRKNRKSTKKVQDVHQGGEQTRCLMVGDSLVGQVTGNHFAKRGPNHSHRAFPGAGVKRVTKEVKKLDPAPRNTLILSVGGNDFFRRDGVPGDTRTLIKDYDDLLKAARSKTGRCVVVGLIPRRSFTRKCYRTAIEVNKKLGDLCKVKGLRFVNPWDSFFGKDRLYARDGIHFSEQGSKMFVKMVSQKLYGPPRVRKPSRLAPREVPRPQTREPERVDTNNNNNSSLMIIEETPKMNQAENSNSNKRRRSPTSDVGNSFALRTPGRKRTRRWSEGEIPDVPSPLSGAEPPHQPSGNGVRSERVDTGQED